MKLFSLSGLDPTGNKSHLAPNLSIALDLPGLRRPDRRFVFPFKRNWVAIVVSGTFLAIFAAPLFVVASGLQVNDDSLFDALFFLFNLFWLMGWSVGVLILLCLFLVFLLGRETLELHGDKMEMRLGIPLLGLHSQFPAGAINGFRPSGEQLEKGDTWRGPHLVCDYPTGDFAFGSNIQGEEAERLIVQLNDAISGMVRISPADVVDAMDEFAAARQQLDEPGAAMQPATAPEAEMMQAVESSPIAAACLVVANLLPLAGVVFFAWDIGDVMLLFWAESAVVGFYTLLKIARVAGWAVLFFGLFFLGHYGGFMAGHLLFIVGFFAADMQGGTDISVADTLARFASLWPVLLGYLVSHGMSYRYNFLARSEYLHTSAQDQMTAPYKRIITMHITIIFGGFLVMALDSALPALALLVILKTASDYRGHRREHQSADTR